MGNQQISSCSKELKIEGKVLKSLFISFSNCCKRLQRWCGFKLSIIYHHHYKSFRVSHTFQKTTIQRKWPVWISAQKHEFLLISLTATCPNSFRSLWVFLADVGHSVNWVLQFSCHNLEDKSPFVSFDLCCQLEIDIPLAYK